ncbi:hypothetical protein OWR29_30500 [Actinoplanes sp. Pm04-4]|uniref:Uncharacterized protein n=1 Tax=Paractinoplanes pyxinae TaxID=2997416 RepID=A0ABT4B777_9ACTN|nr:hypothetical protein [Actinoplanes pyxinae]MCY1142349.1 hypothetical protein [Actinoplanes pyxinae]
MSTRRKLLWAGGVAVLALFLVRVPSTAPASDQVEVYGINDEISGEVQHPPGFLGRLLGMCDADTYYAEAGDKKYCLVLNGPSGTVKVSRRDGTVTVAADDVPRLRRYGAEDAQWTTLLLMGDDPVAMIPIADLTEGRPVTVSALG